MSFMCKRFKWWLTLYLFAATASGFPKPNSRQILCKENESCAVENSEDISARKCKCDYDCLFYGDCCIDVEVPDVVRKSRNPQLVCYNYSDKNSNSGAYMVNTCSEEFKGSQDIRFSCHNESSISDPVMQAPVTDIITGITYRNRYCAKCNGALTLHLLLWLIGFKCDILMEMKSNPNDISWESITYNEESYSWGLRIQGIFHPCSLSYELPLYLWKSVRKCNPNLISRCPDSWSEESIAEACNSYIGIVLVEENVAFKNFHCAICNGYSVKNITCDMDVLERTKKSVTGSFALLLDMNLKSGNQVGILTLGEVTCGQDQIYDPFGKKCRDLVCLSEVMN